MNSESARQVTDACEQATRMDAAVSGFLALSGLRYASRLEDPRQQGEMLQAEEVWSCLAALRTVLHR